MIWMDGMVDDNDINNASDIVDDNAEERYARRGRNKGEELELFASCMAGLENPLADELRSLGIDRVRPLKGGVAFFCEPKLAYSACLWSRLASRIVLVLGRVNARDADLLYAGVYNIQWENIIEASSSIAVHAHGTNEQLRNTRFTSLKVKDALVDRLRDKRDQRPAVDTKSPRVAIDVRVHESRATISLDFSGEALNHRWYLLPDDSEEATLATTVSAGILAVAKWEELARKGAVFVDPVCDDGILAVEAAAIACDMAPGLLRERWGFFGWLRFDEEVWNGLTAEADERFEAGLVRLAGEQALAAPKNARPDLTRVRMLAASSSSPAISRAREHVRRAGLRQVVSVELGDAESAAELVERAYKVARAHLIQPVYAPDSATGDLAGNQMGDQVAGGPRCLIASNVEARSGRSADYRASEATFMAAASHAQEGARFAVAGALDASARFGREPLYAETFGRNRVMLSVNVFDELPQALKTIEIPDAHGGAPHTVEVFEENSAQFAARLRKVFKERRKWAAREGITCYRVYDADLPDYAVAIDLYEGAGEARGNSYLHIAEYAPPASIDLAKARRRFDDVLAIAAVVCEVRPDHVFSKTRVRDSGGSQYRNAGNRAYVTTVQEGGYTFEVDLAGKLDTGIFLDTREVRRLIGQRAAGKTFLNLFAYTGTATVYAAGGGADETLTIDLSNGYLEWARRNMEANGFTGDAYEYERANVMQWITEARRSGWRFDLIYVDPPTFSNSKAMGKRTWDVQRDHVELLVGVSRLLTEGGEAIFCCNLRSFKPYLDDLRKYGVELEDITESTIPHDFARTTRIHKCYIARRAKR